jgi:hypothetical protein
VAKAFLSLIRRALPLTNPLPLLNPGYFFGVGHLRFVEGRPNFPVSYDMMAKLSCIFLALSSKFSPLSGAKAAKHYYYLHTACLFRRRLAATPISLSNWEMNPGQRQGAVIG